MKKQLIFTAVWLVLCCSETLGAAEIKTAALPELFKPSMIAIDPPQGQIIVVDGTTILVYSSGDLRLKKRLGREGEGPREFKREISGLDITADANIVYSVGKLSYFNKDWTFRQERKKPSGRGIGIVKPLADRFVGYGLKRENKQTFYTICIYDREFNLIKEIHRRQSAYQRGKGYHIFKEAYQFAVCGNMVLVAWGKELTVDAFDIRGTRLFSIQQAYRRVRVTDTHKRQALNYYRTNPLTKSQYEWYKHNLVFPPYLPAIRSILAADSRIYVLTYREVNHRNELLVFDLKGRFLQTLLLPLHRTDTLSIPPFTIADSKLYQLIENEDTEEWELHLTPIPL
jgi:hypothetical protein